ncbi:mechanosensitive ion channel [Cyanobacteria bacterium FACHB-63]|nr:mechanosensitive ion channel [Cyanobacteria bacterium FACHB-63]
MARRSPPKSIYHHFQPTIDRVKIIWQIHAYQWVKTATELVRALLFPVLLWGMLWLLVQIFPSSGAWNLNLIATFCLPLLLLFIVYRAIAVTILLLVGKEIHAPLVQHFLLPLFVTYAVIQFLGLFSDISLLGNTQLFTVANTTVTLRGFFAASIGLYLWFAGVSSLARFLRQLLLDRQHIDEATLDALLILLRYLLIGLGLFVVFGELKLDATAIAAISGGLAVGIGFGLKDIVMNFLSGITLLFERSLRPGDIIEFNNKVGKVEEINLRATTIKTADHMEVVIPNQLFWTASLTSYTRRSRLTRFEIEVPISYKYSPETVTAILLEAVRENSRISTSLTAKVEIGRFEPQRIVYKLRFWIDQDHLRITNIRSTIYRRIWQLFEEQGIDPTETVDISFHDSLPISPIEFSRFWTETSDQQNRYSERSHPEQQEISPPPTPNPSKASPQIELLESSFEKIKPHASQFSASFYQNLFRTNPKLRSMFRTTDMEKQQQKLMSALVLLVENVRNPDLLVPVLQDLGAKHKGYGVIEKHYPAVSAALLQTFEQYLRGDWTKEVQQAWTDTFEAIAQIMLEGAEATS